MSFFTSPIPPTPPTSPAATPAGPSARSDRPQASGSVSDAVRVDTLPASPPPEVLDAITVAAQAADALERSGRRVQFTVDPPSGRVTAQLTDHAGAVLGTLTGAQVLAVADGRPPA